MAEKVKVRCDRYPQLRVEGVTVFVDGEAMVSQQDAKRLADLGDEYGIVIDERPKPKRASAKADD